MNNKIIFKIEGDRESRSYSPSKFSLNKLLKAIGIRKVNVFKNNLRQDVARHIVHIQPGNDYPDVEEWNTKEGKAIPFAIEFNYGKASVDPKIGDYMIEKGYASKSRLIIP